MCGRYIFRDLSLLFIEMLKMIEKLSGKMPIGGRRGFAGRFIACNLTFSCQQVISALDLKQSGMPWKAMQFRTHLS
jgi:hypothetical protein